MKYLKTYKIFENIENIEEFKTEIKENFINYVLDECSFDIEDDLSTDDWDESEIYYSISNWGLESATAKGKYIEIKIMGGYPNKWEELIPLLNLFLNRIQTIGYEYKLFTISGHSEIDITLEEYTNSTGDSTYIGNPLNIKIFYETPKN